MSLDGGGTGRVEIGHPGNSIFALPFNQNQLDQFAVVVMSSNNFPYTFSTIPETLQSPFKELFPAYTEGLVQSNPGNFVYHPLYGANAKKFYDFPIRKDDVWIRTFPRSGSIQLHFLKDYTVTHF